MKHINPRLAPAAFPIGTLGLASACAPALASYVPHGSMGRQALDALPLTVPGLRRTVMVEGAGHWLQQERPDEVNAALIEFLAELG